jgi:hypothetical protein
MSILEHIVGVAVPNLCSGKDVAEWRRDDANLSVVNTKSQVERGNERRRAESPRLQRIGE